jgi:predicted cobalt transporter CbtA
MANQTKTVNQDQPSEQCQIEAAKLLKDWSTWLVTVQTAALGLITIFFGRDQALQRNCWSVLMVFFFALSICVATFVLGSLPSIIQHIPPKNYLHDMVYFTLPVVGWRVTLGVVAGIQHAMFLAGVFCLASYLISTFRATG